MTTSEQARDYELEEAPQRVVIDVRQQPPHFNTLKKWTRRAGYAGVAGAVAVVGAFVYSEVEHLIDPNAPSLEGSTPPHGTASVDTETYQYVSQDLHCSANVTVDTGVNVSTHQKALGIPYGGYSEDTTMPLLFPYCSKDGIQGNVAVGSVAGVPHNLTVTLAEYQKTDVSVNWFSPVLCAQPPLTSEATQHQINSEVHKYEEAVKKGTENQNCYPNQRTTGLRVSDDKAPPEVNQIANELSEIAVAITPIPKQEVTHLMQTAKKQVLDDEEQQYPMVKAKNIDVIMPSLPTDEAQVVAGYKSMANDIKTHFKDVLFEQQGSNTDLKMTSSSGAVGIVVLHESFTKDELARLRQLTQPPHTKKVKSTPITSPASTPTN